MDSIQLFFNFGTITIAPTITWLASGPTRAEPRTRRDPTGVQTTSHSTTAGPRMSGDTTLGQTTTSPIASGLTTIAPTTPGTTIKSSSSLVSNSNVLLIFTIIQK